MNQDVYEYDNFSVIRVQTTMKSFKLIVHQSSFSSKHHFYYLLRDICWVIIIDAEISLQFYLIVSKCLFVHNVILFITFLAEDLIINLKDYPGLKEKDIVEIYHPENDYPRLLLQVTKVDAPGRGRGDLFSIFII